jgi:hypothetical protein
MGIHPDYNLQLMVEHIQIECIAGNQIECVDKGRRSTFKSMVHEEERRCCCLPRRGASPAACRGGAPVLLLVDEGRLGCCLSMRRVGVAACRGGASSRGTGHGPWQGASRAGSLARGEEVGRPGAPATGGSQRRARAGARFLHDAAVSFTMRPRKKKRKGIFPIANEQSGQWVVNNL